MIKLEMEMQSNGEKLTADYWHTFTFYLFTFLVIAIIAITAHCHCDCKIMNRSCIGLAPRIMTGQMGPPSLSAPSSPTANSHW